MTESFVLAVPSDGEGGLQAVRAGHFGHCDCFTLVTIEDNQIKETSVLKNLPHEEGGCLRPVNLLAEAGVSAIVAAGMGMRPLSGFNGVGIQVLFDNTTPIVEDVVKLVAQGALPVMTVNEACQHHH